MGTTTVERQTEAEANPRGGCEADPEPMAVDGLLAEHLGEAADALIGDLRARRRPHLFVISGPSGVGKDAVIERLRPLFPEAYFAVTATTRARRPGEVDGVHYYFYSEDDFATGIANGEFLEHATVYGRHYGVPRGQVRQALARGQDVVVKVDIQGAAAIRRLAPHATFIFLAPESMAELLHRLRSRKTDDPEALMRRFGTASRELAAANDFDYVIFNEANRLQQTLEQIAAVVSAERCRIRQHPMNL
ncbi:MAG: Guanylate kinase [uncultured Thermomicrobiales bacterium]|uniref:Guanylate kinase n=1 Tax=uncultured Thermomicrobiales bacterium TaxID=1645740 RepID=A0A6J4U5X7_9BACT|nr:MAG: Guanylate kinase [uncultured Thermomicrobiales bacterium]